MIHGNPDTSFIVRFELGAVVIGLCLVAAVCWIIYETTFKGGRR